MSQPEPVQKQILCVGLEPSARELVTKACPGSTVTEIADADAFGSVFETWEDGAFAMIFCGPTMKDQIPNVELAQVLQNQCPRTHRAFLTFDTQQFQVRVLKKNGFPDAFLLPADRSIFMDFISEKGTPPSGKAFKPVRVADIEVGSEVPFSIYAYMPLNKKHICVAPEKTKIEAAKMAKLQKGQVATAFIDRADLPAFQKYTAERVSKLASGGVPGMSETERTEKIKEFTRDTITGLFDTSIEGTFDDGRQLMKDCEGFISNFITKGQSDKWYDQIAGSIGESSDTYGSAADTATLAALFAIGLQHPSPNDLAIAGFFHNLGLTSIGEEIEEKPLAEMTPEEKEIYLGHPLRSLNILKEKRVIVAPRVEKAILQHHESFRGDGFPNAVAGPKICVEAQILSFTIQFQRQMRVQPGRARLTPKEAFENIKQNGTIGFELLSSIGRLLVKSA